MRLTGTMLEGILPGGGVALLRAIEAFKRVKIDNEDQKHGADIVRKAQRQFTRHKRARRKAARFPDKVNSLVLTGAPIDTDAGNGSIKRMVHESPASFYEELVALRGGLMKGKLLLQGWKNMHPEQYYIQ
jgi:hypothetical protein